jgi:hypothetical protein
MNKYKVGEKVVTIYVKNGESSYKPNRPWSQWISFHDEEIETVSVTESRNGSTVTYKLGTGANLSENQIFSSKNNAIESLIAELEGMKDE